MIKFKAMMKGSLLLAAAAFATTTLAGEAAFGLRPSYVGAQDLVRAEIFVTEPAYMTALEMQSKVISLTGFSHPAFLQYADVLGRVDPKSGQRTNSQPSLMGVMVMQQIAASVASYVVEREEYLGDGDRLVFPRINLSQTLTDEALAALIIDLHTRWLGQAPGTATSKVLAARFRAGEQAGPGPEQGYAALLSLLLQHGALYFY